MIVAGEASGDMHAAHLVAEIRRLNPAIEFSGLGGPALKAQNVFLYHDLTQFAVVGFVEVLKHYGEFKRIFHSFLEKAQEVRPTAVILVDYPGFNLRLAKELKKLGLKVIYYISPQVWAWKENRVETIRRFTDKMLVLFRFEEEFYARHDLKVSFIGHPLIDLIGSPNLNQPTAQADQPLTIGLLPGSREKEIKSLLPVMLQATSLLRQQLPKTEFVLLKAPTISRSLLEKFTKDWRIPITIIEDHIYRGISQCHLCMVASGTATLEVAILNKPMVIIYKTSFLTWLLAKLLIKIPYIGLVNVVAQKKIVPECIQFDATGPKIAREILAIYQNPARVSQIKTELEKVRASLGAPGAGQRAAQEILDNLGTHNVTPINN